MMENIDRKRADSDEGEEERGAQPVYSRLGHIVVLGGRSGICGEREPLERISQG
jgi:hypothetical protein